MSNRQRRTLEGWGYSPLDQIDRDNLRDLRMVWSRALGPGLQQGTPLVYDGVMYMPNPRDVIQAIDGATGNLVWEYQRSLPADVDEYFITVLAEINRNLAIYDGLIIDTSVDDNVFALDPATGRWPGRSGFSTTEPIPPTRRPDPSSRRQDHLGPELRPERRSGRVRHHRLRRQDRRGAVEDAHDSRARRAGGRNLGRRAVRGAQARGRVDGAQLRPGVEPHLHRHVGDVARPEIHARRGRQEAPVPQLDAGARCRHGRDRLVLPAPHDHWDLDHHRRIRRDGRVEQQAFERRLQHGEVRKVVTGIPGKTGVVYTLDREAAEFQWATPTVTQRDQQHRRRHRRRHGEFGGRLHERRPDGAGLPDAGGRQGLGGPSTDRRKAH